jgi:hypothetical protein
MPEYKGIQYTESERQQVAELTKELEAVLGKIAEIVLQKVGIHGKEAQQWRIALPTGEYGFRIRCSTAPPRTGKEALLDAGTAGCSIDPPGVCYPCDKNPWGWD